VSEKNIPASSIAAEATLAFLAASLRFARKCRTLCVSAGMEEASRELQETRRSLQQATRRLMLTVGASVPLMRKIIWTKPPKPGAGKARQIGQAGALSLLPHLPATVNNVFIGAQFAQAMGPRRAGGR